MNKVLRDAQNIYKPEEFENFQKKMSKLIKTSKDESFFIKNLKQLEEK